MTKSFQHEIPKARVNITLDVETLGAKKRQELPLSLLVLGDFSQGGETKPIAERERININQQNFNQVLAGFAPRLCLELPDKRVDLSFTHINDFHPENICRQVPALSELLAMRNLLKEMKASLLDKREFGKALAKLMKNKGAREQLTQELKQIAPLERGPVIPSAAKQ